ncbi:MAG: hypothetical protein M1343_05015 [Chloroflexi bacterium]|nr:hypothetical protein [Chloroflexota bacterium]MDA8189682.1 hypothetical protein [Dehalococcoidales bacterium]
MKSLVLPGIGVLAAVLLAVVGLGVVGGAGLIDAQPAPPQQNQTLPGLEGIPLDQMFSHFMGAEINMTDKNGKALTYKITPGVVSSVGSNNIVITPNGQTVAQTFAVTPTTIIYSQMTKGTLQTLSPGDKVMVVTEGQSMDALIICKAQFAHMMGFRHPMFRQ